MRKTLRIFVLIGLLVSACSLLPGVPATPRPEDVQTAIAQTVAAMPSATLAASATIEPSATASPLPPEPSATVPVTAVPTDTLVPPTATPAIYTPGAPGAQIEESILILQPGLTSRVISPVHIAGMSDPAFEQTLVIEIQGEDGSRLAQEPVIIAADLGQRGPFVADVSFSVTTEQPGRIAVYAQSARDGGLTHLSSVEVTLLPSGPANILTASPHPEVIVITQPQFIATINGGVVHIEGLSGPTFEQHLAIDIQGEDGALVGSGTTTIQADAGQGGAFSVDMPYTVAAEQPGRVVVYDTSARDGGIIHLSSVEVTLSP